MVVTFPPPQTLIAGSKTPQCVNGCCIRHSHAISQGFLAGLAAGFPKESLRHLISLSILIMAETHKTSLRSRWVLPRRDPEPSNPWAFVPTVPAHWGSGIFLLSHWLRLYLRVATYLTGATGPHAPWAKGQCQITALAGISSHFSLLRVQSAVCTAAAY